MRAQSSLFMSITFSLTRVLQFRRFPRHAPRKRPAGLAASVIQSHVVLVAWDRAAVEQAGQRLIELDHGPCEAVEALDEDPVTRLSLSQDLASDRALRKRRWLGGSRCRVEAVPDDMAGELAGGNLGIEVLQVITAWRCGVKPCSSVKPRP
jgi:hypothetical protein